MGGTTGASEKKTPMARGRRRSSSGRTAGCARPIEAWLTSTAGGPWRGAPVGAEASAGGEVPPAGPHFFRFPLPEPLPPLPEGGGGAAPEVQEVAGRGPLQTEHWWSLPKGQFGPEHAPRL